MWPGGKIAQHKLYNISTIFQSGLMTTAQNSGYIKVINSSGPAKFFMVGIVTVSQLSTRSKIGTYQVCVTPFEHNWPGMSSNIVHAFKLKAMVIPSFQQGISFSTGGDSKQIICFIVNYHSI
jgi:hypothetical protein